MGELTGKVQRSRNCHCCGQERVREQHRVGTPTDPDYAVAVCPNCDTLPTPAPESETEL